MSYTGYSPQCFMPNHGFATACPPPGLGYPPFPSPWMMMGYGFVPVPPPPMWCVGPVMCPPPQPVYQPLVVEQTPEKPIDPSGEFSNDQVCHALGDLWESL